MVSPHTAAQAEALAAGLAALTLGRPGSCSLTFRERMEAEEAAFLGALLDLVLLRRLEFIRLHLSRAHGRRGGGPPGSWVRA